MVPDVPKLCFGGPRGVVENFQKVPPRPLTPGVSKNLFLRRQGVFLGNCQKLSFRPRHEHWRLSRSVSYVLGGLQKISKKCL